MSRWKGKGRATEADEDAEMSNEEDTRQNGTNGRVRMAATAFMPLANFRTEPAKPSPRLTTPMRQLHPPPMPLASTSSGSASRAPPSKRARRVLATDEEMEEWEREKGGKKAGDSAVNEEVDGAEDAAKGTKQKSRASDATARPPPDRHPPSARPGAATPKTFRPLTAFGLSPSLTSPKPSTSSSSAKNPARPAPVSALGRLPLPLPAPGRPKTPTTAKEADSKPSKPLAQLSSLLPATSPATPKIRDKEREREKKPILALAPPASVLAFSAEEDGGEGEEGEDEWSPRKKGRGKGYLHSGIAARTSSLLSTSRTTHTLWLHSLSRLLFTTTNSSSGTKEELVERMGPDVRLRVGEVLDPYSSVGAAGGGGGGGAGGAGGGRKTLLTRCRLILPSSSTSPPAEEGEGGGGGAGPGRRDLEGLVFFSLHFSTSSASSTSSSIPSTKPEPGQKPTLIVPQNPHDLARFVSVGREVWVWEPWGEVGVASDLGEFRVERAWRGGVKQGEEEEGEGGVRVEWDAMSGRRGAAEGKEGRQGERKGLVCSRFAVVVE